LRPGIPGPDPNNGGTSVFCFTIRIPLPDEMDILKDVNRDVSLLKEERPYQRGNEVRVDAEADLLPEELLHETHSHPIIVVNKNLY